MVYKGFPYLELSCYSTNCMHVILYNYFTVSYNKKKKMDTSFINGSVVQTGRECAQ